MTLYAGKKPNWARPIDSSDFMTMLSLTKAQADKLNIVEGYSVVDDDGTKHNILHCISRETSIPADMADYGEMDIGSTVFFPSVTTPTVFWKCKKSSTAAEGDWYIEELTVHS